MVRKKFIAPKVLQTVSVQLERDLLGASVRYNMTVSSMGQEIEEHSFDPTDSDADLEAYWE
jgi:hypothetical protein